MSSTLKEQVNYLRLAGLLIVFSILLSGCTVGRCVGWEEVPVTRGMGSMGSTDYAYGLSHAPHSYTTFEKVCTARLASDNEEAIVETKNL